LRWFSVCRHAIAITPVSSLGRSLVARPIPTGRLFSQQRRPSPHVRRVGTHVRILEACSAFTSRYGLPTRHAAMRRVFLEGFDGFVASTAAPIATGWSDPVAGWESHPLKNLTFSRRTDMQVNAGGSWVHLLHGRSQTAPETSSTVPGTAFSAEVSAAAHRPAAPDGRSSRECAEFHPTRRGRVVGGSFPRQVVAQPARLGTRLRPSCSATSLRRFRRVAKNRPRRRPRRNFSSRACQ
jgi:hypothetical protein